MASGFGYGGGTSRCFAFWQEFSKCYASADHPSQCRAQGEDYLECLHRTKEIARAKAVKEEFIRKAEHQAQEGRKAADILADGVIVGVGLIQRDKTDAKSKH
ncbi:NADH:ubiquinone oxidoreductase-like protein [Phanerochaete sordida]|uniref:NADH dehydrogenase [ubiquinone] iron-sulfur protein 5 n=1 Tax=Phanerochaete sordida TaxID=48140 RepID=A0A9P3FXV3_9APHY|nr:NADH:ubiquinone oxidoreductase-like protein [Phanerochaete sordida]